jgi:hypothetical protein
MIELSPATGKCLGIGNCKMEIAGQWRFGIWNWGLEI